MHLRDVMTRGGSISVPAIRGYLELARAHGLDVSEVLRDAGNQELLADIDARVSWQQCESIASSIANRIGVPNMVRTMLSFRGTGFGVLYYVVRNSKTVGTALRRIAEHYHVTSTLARFELVEGPGRARLTLVQHDYLSAAFRQIISVLWAISNVTVLRQLLGDGMRPSSVGLEMPLPARAEDVEILGSALKCPIEFNSPDSTIVMDAALLDEPVINPDPAVEAAMLRHVEEMRARLPADGMAGQVRQYFLDCLQAREPTIDLVARALGTTPRTLQRRLRDEKTSFQQVLDEVRREIALTHMRTGRATIDEIAFLLGFEKPSSFHRAFKRWTGITPGEFRKHAMSPR